MRRLVGVIACVVLMLIATSGRLAAQGGTVRGRVADTTGAPLARVSVSIEAIGARATTNEQGDYEIRGVPAGTHSVRARLLGYVPQIVRVTVSEAQPARQDFALHTQPIGLAPVDVVVGSRARHTAADELAVPVDVFTSEQIQQQGTTETSQILQQLAPSVNFPRQSVTDANDIVRPFTLRGLSPDHTLVLLNGWRRHQTALLNTFPYGSPAGSSGVDLNAIPQSAIDRIEVLRDGASAQYGSDHQEAQRASTTELPLGRRAREGRDDRRQLPAPPQRGPHERAVRVRRVQPPGRDRQRVLALLEQRAKLAGAVPGRLSPRIPPQRERLLGRRWVPGRGQRVVPRPGRVVRHEPLRLRYAKHQQRVARPLPHRAVRSGAGPRVRDGGRSGYPQPALVRRGAARAPGIHHRIHAGERGDAGSARARERRARGRVPAGDVQDHGGRKGLVGQRWSSGAG